MYVPKLYLDKMEETEVPVVFSRLLSLQGIASIDY